MIALGAVEGFFGPEWSWTARHLFAGTLARAGGGFFIYAPKRDPYLRKKWADEHPADMAADLRRLRDRCHALGLRFGLGLSPFEIHDHWTATTREKLREKILKLEDLGGEELGLFFDDMKGAPDLAAKQIEIVGFVRSVTTQNLLFCPTYYSHDAVLDRVFGQRPDGYLEEIGAGIDRDVQILWTGNKVISESISKSDLDTVAAALRRAPFVWDNFFANDGPRQCKFLRLKPLTGRPQDAFASSAGWALNLMNQPSLSEILFDSSARVLREGQVASAAFRQALERLAGPDFADLALEQAPLFNDVGLDRLDEPARAKLQKHLHAGNRFEADVLDWLNGLSIVGPECLTD